MAGHIRTSFPFSKNIISARRRRLPARPRPQPRQSLPAPSPRDDHRVELLGGIPLNEKTGEENGVAKPADDFPDVPFDADKLPVLPEQICEPIHFCYSASSFSTFSSSLPRAFMSHRLP